MALERERSHRKFYPTTAPAAQSGDILPLPDSTFFGAIEDSEFKTLVLNQRLNADS